MRLPFALPDIGDEEIDAVAAAMRSGWITTGPNAHAFQEEFVAFLEDPTVQAVAVNSATAGLHLALEALGIGPGDEVIAPSLTFTATVEVVRYLGAEPILVDVDSDTLCMSVDSMRAAITDRTKCVVPVHYGGLPCDMSAILKVAREHGLKVVEDAAHALPARYEGRLIGTLQSDATVFSFYANKTMTTGEGGMVVARDQAIIDRMKVMRLHGIDRDAFNRFRSDKPAWYYEVVAPGYKYNLTDIGAALGRVQLRRLPSFQMRREQLARRYFERLAGLPLILPARPNEAGGHSWHLYVVRLDDAAYARGITRDQVIMDLSKRGIGTSVHYVPLHRQPYWRDRGNLRPEQFPQSEHAYQRMISIPLFTAMTDADQEYVIDALHELLR